MQDLDNNLDDLFKKAANNYRPALGESEWEKIAPKLTQYTNGNNPPQSKKISFKYASILLVLLLLTSTFYLVNYFYNNKSTTIKSLVSDATIKSIDTATLKISKGNESIKIQSQSKRIALLSDATVSISTPEKANEIYFKSRHSLKTNMPALNRQTNVVSDYKLSTIILDNAKTKLAVDLPHETPVTQNPAKYMGNQPILETIVNDESTNILALNKDVKIAKPAVVPQPAKQKNFYIGLVAAPEYCDVKNLKLNKVGFKIGIVGGYQLNSKLSFETGLFYSKKNYIADGKYFNMEKVQPSMPVGMQVISLTGSSNVFEIPVKLNYTIAAKKNLNVYAAAGLTSSLLSTEKNIYNTILDGSQKDIAASYQKKSVYIAATADLYFGFEKKLNNGNRVRLEPFVQLPLKGIGIGNLKITSAGIHAGYLLFPKK